MSGADRRKHPRYPVKDVPVRITSAETSFLAQLTDICRDAVLVETDRVCALQAEVALVVELPGTGGPIEVMGHVIRLVANDREPNGMAILFSHVTPAASDRIDYFVALQG